MSLNVEIKSNIHNRFDIFKENVKTGVKEQVGYAENIVLDAMWPRLCGGSTYFVNIHYGTGTGPLSPARTSLFSHLGTGAAATVETVRAIPTSYWRRSITLGLTTANGSTLTEVGIAYGTGSTNLVTHAQIRDMNGNPTGIVKTDVDIITIYATVYITLINDHASIKLCHPNSNGLLSYLFGSTFPSAVFIAGMGNLELSWPYELVSYTLGSSGTGSWSADVANKKRTTSTMRFETAVNGHIKELGFSNIARLLLPATGIYTGLELSDVPIGTGDGINDTFDLPSAYIDQASIVAKVDGVSSAVTKTNSKVIYKTAPPAGGLPTSSGNGVAFSPDGSIMAMTHQSSPFITMYKDIDGVWTKMPNVTGGYPSDFGKGVAFSHDSTTMAVATWSSPNITMYKDIEGVWTKLANPTGGLPTSNGNGVAFSPDGTIMVVAHYGSPYITMYKDIEGVWTKMANVTGGYPTDVSNGVAFSPDGTTMAVAHNSSPYITMYKDIDGVWTKMATPTGGLPTNQGYGVAFSPDSTTMAVAHRLGTCIAMYKDIEGVWTRMADPTGGLSTNTANGVAFSPDGTIMAVAHNSGTYLTMYKDIEGVWTKMATPAGGLPTNISKGVAFSQDSTTMAVSHDVSPFITMYTNAPIMTQITLTTPPAEGAVITADYTVNGIHKTNQRVIDISGEIQFGEPT